MNHLRSLREAKGLTLEQLASALGTTNQQISLLELGKRQLTVAWMTRLASVLDCHPWALIDDETGELTSAEHDLVARFRRLSVPDREHLLSTLAQLEASSEPPKAKAS
ncbi:MAG: helix-turn-helix transcriptional regulator [Phenylobacterium sp.]|uniref:helix-turn-helix domain-containing protein n=1 Tax=Phenylobacterium sp. TaxID=1871053 RepID=UPI001B41EC4E|nr:helix-turn-helix transcriptional regulator [Phenylobacterium sp.]MBP7818058.1 helix-turn-helix transcriptional regulator [Phenylobacterium sp.]MBP9753790.1 helix-turn-helix transcriptional regulator [Phenylobacterium sp.]